MATESATDMSIGLGVAFGLLTAVGAGAMLLVPSQDVTLAGISVASWGFAAAMVAGVLAVVAVQALWD